MNWHSGNFCLRPPPFFFENPYTPMRIAKGPQKGLKDQMGQKGQKGQALLQRARFERFGSQRAKKGSPVSGDSDGNLRYLCCDYLTSEYTNSRIVCREEFGTIIVKYTFYTKILCILSVKINKGSSFTCISPAKTTMCPNTANKIRRYLRTSEICLSI